MTRTINSAACFRGRCRGYEFDGTAAVYSSNFCGATVERRRTVYSRRALICNEMVC